jgi:Ca2+-binding RTX toxin-like protein
MRVLRVAVLSAVVALAVVAVAYAGTVTQDSSGITYRTDSSTSAGEVVTVGIENGAAFVTSERGLTAPPNCQQTNSTRIDCPVTSAFLVFFGFDDSLSADLAGAASLEAHGGAGGDSVAGTINADKLYGDDGDDRLESGPGNDLLDGGPGVDALRDGPGDDTAIGGAGDDYLTSDPGRDTFAGGDGRDRVDYSNRTAPVTITLDGQADDGEAGEGDNIAADVESATGGSGNDKIVAGPGEANLEGGPGNDSIKGSPGEDRIEGGEGDDTIDARDGRYDSIDCGPGNDTVIADLGDGVTSCEIAPDRDGDGYANEQDCAPDDPAVNPGAGEIFGNAIDEDCKDGPGYLRVDAGVVFKYKAIKHPPSITWTTLRATALDTGDRVEVRCKGKGCPFKLVKRDAISGNPQLDLKSLFKKRKLKKGVVVEIRILHEAQIGIVRTLTVAKGPKVKELRQCLLVGAAAPSSCPAT